MNSVSKMILSGSWLFVDLVTLYIVWSLIGVLLEGSYSRVVHGRWETHVVSMIGPFCIVYGAGAVVYYLVSAAFYSMPFVFRFLILASAGTVCELLAGLLLLYGVRMRAWDYTGCFMNYKGVICLQMFLVWGAIGAVFCRFLLPISSTLAILHRKPADVIAVLAAVLLAADLVFTGICILRWKKRRDGVPAATALDGFLDRHYPDAYMQHRFIEWRFIDSSKD